ncbi:MAG: ATP-binding protein [Candidatus Rokubacteria bacterium]|nr:ATP-binding protein [Candidatus Rokubacteria bacterium]
MGETRVDLLHLLEDLRDAYPGPAEETILTEIVANCLDSRATTITITADPAARNLALVDDGLGMRRRELARYHDIAATAKVRGEGIGFAGVGIKVALLLCREVLTETRQGPRHVATTWALASRHRAPWIRAAPRRPGARPAGGVHGVGERGPPGIPPRGGLALRGVPHRARLGRSTRS